MLLGEWDDAIGALALAVEMEPNRAERRADLSCAYYMRGRTTDSLNDFARALETLDGVNLPPTTDFNRALILEQLRDREAAASAWRTYLSADADSRWAAEARKHLRANSSASRPEVWKVVKPALLTEAYAGNKRAVADLTRRFHLDSRETVEAELLPGWIASIQRTDQEQANRQRTATRTIAEAIAARTADRYLVDLADEIDDAAGVPNRATLEQLASGYRLYRLGLDAIQAEHWTRATPLLERSMETFQEVGSPAAALPGYMLIRARYYSLDWAGAERIHDQLVASFRDRATSYPTLFALLAWTRGILWITQGSPSEALSSFESARAVFARTGEHESEARQHSNLADAYLYLGETELAAVHRYRALTITASGGNPVRLHSLLSGAADAAIAEGFLTAALRFQDRLVRLAHQSENPNQIADALIKRSTIHQRKGNRPAALEDLVEATAAAHRIADDAARERVLADVSLADAFIWRDIDHRRVVDSLTPAVEFFRRMHYRFYLAQTLLQRGRAHLRIGDIEGAEADFRDGIAELEGQRRRVGERELRITFFDRAEGLFSELARLLVRRGRMAEAFDLLERGRARELLDSAAASGAQNEKPAEPLPVREIQRRMPPAHVLVTYSVAAEDLLVFVLTRRAIRALEQPIAERELVAAIEAVGEGFRSPAGLPRERLRWLGTRLIEPLGLDGRESRVVFVPDRSMYRLPFAALMPGPDRYLVDDHIIQVAPSATMFIRSIERDRLLARIGDGSALILTNGDIAEGFPSLAPLLEADKEGERIAATYPRARLVQRFDGTSEELLAEAGNTEIVHLGTHAVVNERLPGASFLLVGKKARLYAAEIERARLRRSRLVVLGACGTGVGKAHRGEGVMSLARAFLAASVPAVIGTLAPVDDRTAATLLTDFHHCRRAAGMDAPAALRSAQLAMRHDRHRSLAEPSHWASFQIIGGSWPAEPTNQKEEALWASR